MFINKLIYVLQGEERWQQDMKNAKLVNINLANHLKASKKIKRFIQPKRQRSDVSFPYSSIVRSLMYAIIHTKPENQPVVQVVSRFFLNFKKKY